MSKAETVKVKHPDPDSKRDFMIIYKSDFDPKVHEEFDKPKPKAKAKTKSKTTSKSKSKK